MARAHQIVGAVFVLVGLFVLWQSFEMRYFTRLGPGPGFFGVWLGALLALLATVYLVQNTLPRTRPTAPLPLPVALARFRLLVTILGLGLTVVMLPVLGFRLTVLGLCLLILRVVGREPWLTTLVVSLAASFGVFYVFNDLLAVVLPVGYFGV